MSSSSSTDELDPLGRFFTHMDIEKKKKKICSCHEKCSYCLVTSFSIESATVIAYLSEKISISNGALVITSARHCDQAQTSLSSRLMSRLYTSTAEFTYNS